MLCTHEKQFKQQSTGLMQIISEHAIAKYAVKLADTFEDFFIKGIGIDVLIQNL